MTRFLTAAVLCMAVTTPALSQEGQQMNDDQKAVLNTITDMTQAFHAKDIDRVMASYEEPATIMFQPGVPSQDHAGAVAGFQGFFGFDPTFTYGAHEVIINGDTALHITPWTMTGKLPDGTAMSDKGLSVAVLKRQADGGWKMVIDNPYGAHVMSAE